MSTTQTTQTATFVLRTYTGAVTGTKVYIPPELDLSKFALFFAVLAVLYIFAGIWKRHRAGLAIWER